MVRGQPSETLRRSFVAWLRRTESRDPGPNVASARARARNRQSLLDGMTLRGVPVGNWRGLLGPGLQYSRWFRCAIATLETALGPIQMQPSPAPWSCLNAGPHQRSPTWPTTCFVSIVGDAVW
jgi:hypothetical protein